MQKGFTLIELLVVISIIGILASVGVVSFGTAQTRARDSQRKSDLSQIQKALEIYKNDFNQYPTSVTFGAAWTPYMNKVPQDPKNGSPAEYVYVYIMPRVTGDNLTYSLRACLENANDAQKDGTKDSACTNASYTKTEP